jgi:hypothetical protein
VRALWKGASPVVFGKGFIHSIIFGVNGTVKGKLLQRRERQHQHDRIKTPPLLSLWEVGLAGGAAGVAAAAVVTPIDRSKSVLMVQEHSRK